MYPLYSYYVVVSLFSSYDLVSFDCVFASLIRIRVLYVVFIIVSCCYDCLVYCDCSLRVQGYYYVLLSVCCRILMVCTVCIIIVLMCCSYYCFLMLWYCDPYSYYYDSVVCMIFVFVFMIMLFIILYRFMYFTMFLSIYIHMHLFCVLWLWPLWFF